MGDKTLSRRQSRRKAFELLFELEQHPIMNTDSILERTFTDLDVVESYTEDPDEDGYVTGLLNDQAQLFVTELLHAVKAHERELDEELAKYPHDWSYDRIGIPERVLLRLALAEMAFLGTSYKVVINEALDLTKLYAQEESSRFINGILGSAVKNLEQFRSSVGHTGGSDDE